MNTESLDADFRRFVETGDGEALARVFDGVAPRLLLVAAHLVRDAADAEDLVQATFLAALRDAGSWDGVRPVAVWLAGILRHRAIDRYRADDARPTLVSTAEADVGAGRERDPAEAVADAEVFEVLAAAVAKIEEPYCTPLTLRLVHGLTPNEVAHALGRAPGTVRMQLKRGLEKLRAALPDPSVLTGAIVAAVVAGEGGRGLAAVKLAVLAEAPGAVVPVASALTVAGPFAWQTLLLLAALVPLVVFAALQLRSVEPGSRAIELNHQHRVDSASASPAPPVAPSLAAGEFASARTPLELDARGATVNTPANGTVSSAAAPSASEPAPTARIHGRVLMPDGSPAVGSASLLIVRQEQEKAAEPLVFPLDGDGSYDRTFEVGSTTLVNLCVEVARHAPYTFVATGSRAGDDLALGDLVIGAGGRVRGRIVDERGGSVASSSEVRASIRSSVEVEGVRWSVDEELELDPRAASFVSGRLPLGPASVLFGNESWFDHQDLTMGADDVEVELVFRGPRLESAVVLVLHSGIGLSCNDIAPEHVRLVQGDTPIDAVASVLGDVWTFADLWPGEYSAVVDDPRFLPVEHGGLTRGTRTAVALEGNVVILALVKRANGQSINNFEASASFDTHADGVGSSADWYPLDRLQTQQPTGSSFVGIPSQDQTWRIDAPGFAAQFVHINDLEPNATHTIEVTLEPARAMTGTVVDTSGAPAVGVLVRAWPLRVDGTSPFPPPLDSQRQLSLERSMPVDPRSAITDAEGHFAIEGLDTGAHDVEAFVSDWVRVASTGHHIGDSVKLRLPGRVDVHARLVNTVGAPLAGYSVSVLPVAFEQRRREPRTWCYLHVAPPGVVDTEGNFELVGVPLEPVEVCLHAPLVHSNGRGWSPGTAYSLGVIDPRTESLDGRTFDATAFVPGTARVRATLDGAPWSGAEVSTQRNRSELILANYSPSGATDARGNVVLEGLESNSWTIICSPADRAFSIGTTADIELEPGGALECSFDVQVGSGVLTFETADGASLAGRALSISGRTDDSNRYPVSANFWHDGAKNTPRTLPIGHYQVRLMKVETRQYGPALDFEWTKNGPEPAVLVLAET